MFGLKYYVSSNNLYEHIFTQHSVTLYTGEHVPIHI